MSERIDARNEILAVLQLLVGGAEHSTDVNALQNVAIACREYLEAEEAEELPRSESGQVDFDAWIASELGRIEANTAAAYPHKSRVTIQQAIGTHLIAAAAMTGAALGLDVMKADPEPRWMVRASILDSGIDCWLYEDTITLVRTRPGGRVVKSKGGARYFIAANAPRKLDTQKEETSVRKYTSVYWYQNQVQIHRFEAANDDDAFHMHDEMGWNAYDDRRMLAGHVETAEIPMSKGAVVTELGSPMPVAVDREAMLNRTDIP